MVKCCGASHLTHLRGRAEEVSDDCVGERCMSGLVGVGSRGVCWHFEVACHYFCHFERREKSRIGDCCRCNDFRFFTSLCCVQNDRGERALCSEWQNGGRSEDRIKERFKTGWGRCVRNDRIGGRSGMAGKGCCVWDGGIWAVSFRVRGGI